jgi:hypothetical protein
MRAVELCNTQHFEARIPTKLVQFFADEANACLRDWFDTITEAAAEAREKLAKKAYKSRRKHFSMEKAISRKKLVCPKLSFRKIHRCFKDGAELRNLIRLFGGEAGADSHGGGSGAGAGEEKKGPGGGGGAKNIGGGVEDQKARPQSSALKQIFFDDKSKRFHCFEYLQGRSCDAKKCNFLHEDNLSPAKKDVLLKALKALKTVQGGSKFSPPK